ncbi:MAG TPA: hypothetical protein VMD02_07210 [Candidatus Omnitrophota bacterium]|nr:hypothetical protein [Candidatus Omnitrophota bacterium]
MAKLRCTVCEHEIDIPENVHEGERITCPNCFAQLSLHIHDGKKRLKCAVCSKDLKECGLDCERKLSEREKRGFFDIKL